MTSANSKGTKSKEGHRSEFTATSQVHHMTIVASINVYMVNGPSINGYGGGT
jgi:hypothetical protein